MSSPPKRNFIRIRMSGFSIEAGIHTRVLISVLLALAAGAATFQITYLVSDGGDSDRGTHEITQEP